MFGMTVILEISLIVPDIEKSLLEPSSIALAIHSALMSLLGHLRCVAKALFIKPLFHYSDSLYLFCFKLRIKYNRRPLRSVRSLPSHRARPCD